MKDLVERGAKSDAEFDGRSWLGMPAAERKRYLARAERSVAIVAGELAARLDTEALAVITDAPPGDVARINHALQVASALATEAEAIRSDAGVQSAYAWEAPESS